MFRRFTFLALATLGLAIPFGASAETAIKVGFPIILSGPGALFGEPALKGAQMFVEEINAKGGVLGRKLELLERDSKASADEAVRLARELIIKENVDFLSGTLTSAEAPAVSTIAKENKIVFIAPTSKTVQLDFANKPAPLHFPPSVEYGYRRTHGRFDYRRMEGGETGRHHCAGLCLWT